MSALRTPFLQKKSYRRRRLADAARLLPVAGAVLLLIPLLLPQVGADAETGAEAVRTSSVGLYVFAVWLALAIAALGLSFGLSETDAGPPDRHPDAISSDPGEIDALHDDHDGASVGSTPSVPRDTTS